MRCRTFLSSLWLAAAITGLPQTSLAAGGVDDGSRATARKLGYSGVEAYQAGDFRTANEKLEKSYQVLQVPSVGLWSARTLVKLGRLVEASERYLEVARLGIEAGDQNVQKRAQADAATELKALTARIPTLTISLEGATAEQVQVSVDGTPISSALVGEARPVNPGPHKVEGKRGTEVVVADLTLEEGENKPAPLLFASAASAPAAPAPVPTAPAEIERPHTPLGTQRTLALVAGGVGVAGVVVGSVFGVRSKSKHDEAAQYCDGSVCNDQRGVDAGESAHSAGNVSTIGMIVGALGLGGGVVLWLTAPQSKEEHAELRLGLGGIQLQGKF